MVSSIHSLDKGGVNMNAALYAKMKHNLQEFGDVDIADFCVHYLQEFYKHDDRSNRSIYYKRNVDESQTLVDNLASYLHTRGETWE
jgi:hypothetical protein